MKPTNLERSILIRLNRALGKFSENKDDCDFHDRPGTILQDGYYVLHDDQRLPWTYAPLTRDQMVLVEDVMTMYQRMQRGYADLGATERKAIHADALTFPGFDGSIETELVGYAQFLHERLGRFPDLKAIKGMDSRCPSVDRYRRMLRRMPAFHAGIEMSAGDISRVLRD